MALLHKLTSLLLVSLFVIVLAGCSIGKIEETYETISVPLDSSTSHGKYSYYIWQDSDGNLHLQPLNVNVPHPQLQSNINTNNSQIEQEGDK